MKIPVSTQWHRSSGATPTRQPLLWWMKILSLTGRIFQNHP